MEQRDWYYLLPSGETAENMKDARELMEIQSGSFISSWTFRELVKKGTIKKVNRSNNSNISQGYATSNSKANPSL